jgi:chromosome condensin MukBEF ATPase and DNA-binding subunit MukB
MYSSHKTISEQFESLTTLPMFEIETIDKRTKEQEYIIFNISLLGSKFIAEHIALNQEQENSYKIAYCSIVSSNWLTLDENLEELYFECIEAINNSEFYELSE